MILRPNTKPSWSGEMPRAGSACSGGTACSSAVERRLPWLRPPEALLARSAVDTGPESGAARSPTASPSTASAASRRQRDASSQSPHARHPEETFATRAAHASEQRRLDMLRRRSAWVETQPDLDAEKQAPLTVLLAPPTERPNTPSTRSLKRELLGRRNSENYARHQQP